MTEKLIFVVLFAATAVGLYLLARLLRRFGAWLYNRPSPQERFEPFLIIVTILGAVVGYMVHEPAMAFVSCYQAGQPVGECLLIPLQ
jgi:hypothetical protein